MKEYIASFIKEKDLSENSQTAYSYDLDQFVDTVHNHVSDTNLRIYQASIKDFKPAVQKRKLSAVNQFLFYLYQYGQESSPYLGAASYKLTHKCKTNRGVYSFCIK